MKTKIIFSKRAQKELEKLDRSIQKRIDVELKEKLEKDSEKHLISLTGSLNGLYKFRVGDYRLICKKEEEKLVVLVVTIQHRSEVYK
jgi:mRNA interferase RelE/StbE